MRTNVDSETVEGFGAEWKRFDQRKLDETEARAEFERYFSTFPWSALPPGAVGFDMGCGSGRWARFAAERCGLLHCIDASKDALLVTQENLAGAENVQFHLASVDSLPLEDGSMDFGYSLGVLHHVPEPSEGLRVCVRKLKSGSPFLVYLYYAFDNRPDWFRLIWRVSDLFRRGISTLPFRARSAITDVLAGLVYFPLAKLAMALERLGLGVEALPLSVYRNHSFYTMRTDALDRFGTRLEQRFTRRQIEEMMADAGLQHIVFREGAPYWCATGYKA
jgi:SAM-dependent methyltransferase